MEDDKSLFREISHLEIILGHSISLDSHSICIVFDIR